MTPRGSCAHRTAPTSNTSPHGRCGCCASPPTSATRSTSITAGLPALAEDNRAPRAPRDGRAARSAAGDPLLELEPAVYVSALLGVPIGRDRKVSCPFHADEHPSLHVYPTAAQGWHCFSCRRGGSVYDLAGELMGMQTRGVEFLQLRALLRERLLGRVA